MNTENVKLNENFTQVCVWPGTVVGAEKLVEFIDGMFEYFNTRVQYLEEIKTNPDLDTFGNKVEDTGGRNDLFFAVHQDDVLKFATPRRLSVGIRWVEDVMSESNQSSHLYPKRVKDYCSWEA